jgi:hypothetical protein
MKGGSTTIPTILGDIRSFIVAGHQNFPLAIAGTFLILGLMTANYAMLFILVGFLIITPVLSMILNGIMDSLTTFFPSISSITQIKRNDICDIIIGFPSTAQSGMKIGFTSIWLSMMSFIMSYILFNAVELLNIKTEYPKDVTPEDKEVIDSKASRRTTQAIISIAMIAILMFIILLMRIRNGCETIVGGVVTIGIFGTLGFYWYQLLSAVGNNRLSDIFGIANRLMSPDSMLNAPVACLPESN